MPGPRSRRRPARPGRPATPLPALVPPRLPARLALRRLWNAVNLATPLGLSLARASGCAVGRGPLGLLLATGYRWPFPDGGAFTVGNVVFFRPRTAITPQLMAHESRHATQYAWCAGLPFLVLYAVAVGWSLLRTGDTASRNVFERHAGLAAGGYRERPVRWPRRPA
jgi:hypothetical protein